MSSASGGSLDLGEMTRPGRRHGLRDDVSYPGGEASRTSPTLAGELFEVLHHPHDEVSDRLARAAIVCRKGLELDEHALRIGLDSKIDLFPFGKNSVGVRVEILGQLMEQFHLGPPTKTTENLLV